MTFLSYSRAFRTGKEGHCQQQEELTSGLMSWKSSEKMQFHAGLFAWCCCGCASGLGLEQRLCILALQTQVCAYVKSCDVAVHRSGSGKKTDSLKLMRDSSSAFCMAGPTGRGGDPHHDVRVAFQLVIL